MADKAYYSKSQRPPYFIVSAGGNSAESVDVTPVSSLLASGTHHGALGSKSNPLSSLHAANSSSHHGGGRKEEADAAAGGFTHRVSSFANLMPRNQSMEMVRENLTASRLTPSKKNAMMAPNNKRLPQKTDAAAATLNQQLDDNPLNQTTDIKPDWRLRDRMKTVGIGLVMALNVGTDPPDLTKPSPCAVLQCWMNPFAYSRAKAKELIGERLEQQYAKWQLARTARPLKYRRALDPTVEDVRTLCLQLRRQARSERVLLHYNGHGVPRPTENGEIWVFDKNHTEYIPLSIIDLRQWLGKPSLVVLDCSSAGMLLPYFTTSLNDSPSDSASSTMLTPVGGGMSSVHPSIESDLAGKSVRDTIVLCPCSEGEWLPMHPDYPADIFTSCLTTPIPMALRWFVRRNQASMSGLHPDAVDAIPGKATDRKTPLGELNWIFTAVTDSIAWNILPKPLFQRLFRQDLMVASMFRNFLLADRILRSLDCTPVSHPPLPAGIADHPLWQAWDLACETLIFQLMKDGSLGNHVMVSVKPPAKEEGDESLQSTAGDTGTSLASSKEVLAPMPIPPPETTVSSEFISSPFFSEQLTAFEVWLEFASIHKMQLSSGRLESPEQLPIVLQVLLSQVHRIRALRLLRQFLDLGPWAVNLSLSLGIFPYVMKLLQSPEYKSLLVSIWASVLAFDPSCRIDLLKDGAFHHFLTHLVWGLNGSVTNVAQAAKERTMAAFVLAAACNEYPAGQAECVRLNLHGSCCALLSSYEQGENSGDDTVELHLPAHFRLWVCLCLGNMFKENVSTQNEAYSAGVHSRLFIRLNDKNVDVRAAVCYAIGCLIGSTEQDDSSSAGLQQSATSQQQQQHAPMFQGSSAMLPQRLQPATNVDLPGGATATTGAPGQLQPSFTSASNMTNLQWRPQQMQSMPGGQPIHLAQGQPMPAQSQGHLLNQPMQLRAPNGQPIQGQYMIHGQPLQPHHPTMGPPAGFFLGGSSMPTGQGQGTMHPPQLHHQTPMQTRYVKPTVFEDRHRLELDLLAMEALSKAVDDGSVVVRYEATVALAGAIGKYLDGFIIVAEESTAAASLLEAASRQSAVPLPRGLERKVLDRLGTVWKAIRSLQHGDSFPSISKAANDVVSFVHEHLLYWRTENDTRNDEVVTQTKELNNVLGGIEEEMIAAANEPDLQRSPFGSPLIKPVPRSAAPKQRTRQQADLRRVASEVAPRHSGMRSMEQTALLSRSSYLDMTDLSKQGTPSMDYTLPKSKFYKWKMTEFDTNFEVLDENNGTSLDPLSPAGAGQAYQDQRNYDMEESGQKVALQFVSLAPKPPTPTKKSIEMLLEEEDQEALMAAEEESSGKKKQIELKEQRLLRNRGRKMTGLLRFHSYENVLMACGALDFVTMWNTENGNELAHFVNGNPKGTRITGATWINEEMEAKFLVGCDDGTVRIWGNLLEANGEGCSQRPSLLSSFNAVPTTADRSGSGLVCEWQPFSGTLLAGGSSKFIRCWDLQAEKPVRQLETNTDAYVTTLTTAWDYDSLGMGSTPQGYQGIGRDIVVAGHSDGSLKILDMRAKSAGNDMLGRPASRPRRAPSQYTEHKSWVVATAFTGYGSRYELISGTVAGDIKVWDLRMSSSIRTLEIQRSTMTALAVHSKIPMVATGSSAQFIKIITLDGDTLQVIRYHGTAGTDRIGPVSSLAFHRYKPLLAAGATDNLIGLYTPKKQIT